jgi:UDP-glucose 4-epimerase
MDKNVAWNSRSRRAVLVGGGGFIGRNLTEALLKDGWNVRCFDRVKPQWLGSTAVEFVEGDFAATNLTAEVIDGNDVVFHLACTTLPQTSNEDPAFDISSNVHGTVRMLDEAVKSRVRKFIFISSGGTVYGVPAVIPTPETHATNPTCSYGITKLMLEKYLRLYSHIHGLCTCSLRLSNPYGRYQRVDSIQGAVAVFCYKALTGRPIQIWGDGSVRRDFIHISDVVNAMVRIIDSPLSGEVNIGSGRAASIGQVIDTIEELVGRRVDRKYFPARSFDVPVTTLDISLARTELRWEPRVCLRDGIESTIEWMRDNYSEIGHIDGLGPHSVHTTDGRQAGTEEDG